MIEARRCLHCGRGAEVIDRKCIRCLTCVRCCPFLVPHMEGQAVFPEETCIACGFCASQCPAYAINIRRLEPPAMRQRVADILIKGPREITFACMRGLSQPGGAPGSGHGVVGLPEDFSSRKTSWLLLNWGPPVWSCGNARKIAVCRRPRPGSSAWSAAPMQCW